MKCTDIASAIRERTSRSTRVTTRRLRCSPPSSTRPLRGGRPPAAHPVARDGDLRAACQRLRHRHPRLPEAMRGTYAGLGSDEAMRHLQDLGITAVELMPVHHHAYDRHLVQRHLSNYWGYNTSAFLAPDTRYSMSKSSQGACVNSRRWSVICTRRDRGDSGRRVTHSRGRSPRADALAARRRQCRTTGSIPNRVLPGLYGLWKYVEHAPSRACCSSSWTACVLDPRDARRWIPVRSGKRPRPRITRRRSTGRLLRHHHQDPSSRR